MASSESHDKRMSRTVLTSLSVCKLYDVMDSLSLLATVFYHDFAFWSDCLEMWKEKNENQDHVRVRCLDRNCRGSAFQRMDDVKEDPCVGLQLVA